MAQPTFHFHSEHWTDTSKFNLAGGETGWNTAETKLPTYWTTPFSKICLGMKVGQQIKFTVINEQVNSFYSLIGDGQYRTTSLGRDKWKTLIGSQASLQSNCNKEGFNVVCDIKSSKARIGFVWNNQDDYSSCDSKKGFRTRGLYDDSNTCGNQATRSGDNGTNTSRPWDTSLCNKM